MRPLGTIIAEHSPYDEECDDFDANWQPLLEAQLLSKNWVLNQKREGLAINGLAISNDMRGYQKGASAVQLEAEALAAAAQAAIEELDLESLMAAGDNMVAFDTDVKVFVGLIS